ncbi:MAG: transaldolase family protein, partial [Candidatus Promineifilaceae bacterium]
RIAQAYITGLETYFRTHSVWRTTPTSVASFSLSPLDHAVDERLEVSGYPELQGKTAIASARLLYARYWDLFSGPRWKALADRGARPLRPKWTRLRPKDDQRPPTMYIDALIGPDTVITFTPATLELFLEEGRVARTLDRQSEAAEDHLARIAGLGIDLEVLAEEIQREHLKAADRQYQALIAGVIQKLLAEASQH